MPDTESSESGEQRVRRRRRRRRSAEETGELRATDAAGIQLDQHPWHAGSGQGRDRSRGRDGKDSGRRNVNPLVRRSNRLFIRLALLVLTGVSIFAAYQQGTRNGSSRERMRNQALLSKSQVGTVADPSEARRQAMVEVDKGYESLANGNPMEAVERFQAAKDIDPRLPGVYVEMGLAWSRMKNPVEADTMFLKAIRTGEDAPRAHYHRGVLLAGAGSFPESFQEFRSATELAPFDPYPWFFWGEALRAQGKPAEAVEKLQKAEVRAVEQSDLFVIRTKRLLCMIEAQSPEVEAHIDSELAKSEPGGEWLLAAAAHRLRHEQYAEAGPLLQRAKAALQPLFFRYLLADKFFDLYRGRPEVAAAIKAG
jgi:tetratricopeptide (TPR) repeat protein